MSLTVIVGEWTERVRNGVSAKHQDGFMKMLMFALSNGDKEALAALSYLLHLEVQAKSFSLSVLQKFAENELDLEKLERYEQAEIVLRSIKSTEPILNGFMSTFIATQDPQVEKEQGEFVTFEKLSERSHGFAFFGQAGIAIFNNLCEKQMHHIKGRYGAEKNQEPLLEKNGSSFRMTQHGLKLAELIIEHHKKDVMAALGR